MSPLVDSVFPPGDDPDALTLRQISELWGRSLNVIRSWRDRWPDWPPPAGSRLVLAGRNKRRTRALVFDAARVRRCIVAHRQLPASTQGLWTMRQAAAELGLGEDIVRDARRRGSLPRPAGFVDRSPMWRPSVLRDWAQRAIIPDDAWTAAQVESYTELTADACVHRGLTPDGRCHGSTRWWYAEHVRDWWQEYHSIEESLASTSNKRPTGEAEARAEEHPAAPAELRWSLRDVANGTGLSYLTVRTYRKLHKLPQPDGLTAAGRPWWSPNTIRAWDQPAATGRPRQSLTQR